MKYIIPTISFLFSLVAVALIVNLALVLIFPPKETITIGLGISSDWRVLCGTLFGIWAGTHSWKAAVRVAREKKGRERSREG
jgi:hypothetical protein